MGSERQTMDLLFKIPDGSTFKIEVPFFSTVLQVKKKVQEHHGFPHFHQLLFFRGKLLNDETYIKDFDVHLHPRVPILLSTLRNPNPYITQTTQPEVMKPEMESTSPALLQKSSDLQTLDLIFEIIGRMTFKMQVSVCCTFLEVKKKIKERCGLPESHQVLFFRGKPMKDEAHVGHLDIPNLSHIFILLRASESPNPNFLQTNQPQVSMPNTELTLSTLPQVPASFLNIRPCRQPQGSNTYTNVLNREPILSLSCPSSGSTSNPNPNFEEDRNGSRLSRRMPIILNKLHQKRQPSRAQDQITVIVMQMDRKKGVAVMVNGGEEVKYLREKLRKLVEENQMEVPEEFFFIHNQSVMTEEKSFSWHEVKEMDVIEVFRGWVSEGCPY